MLNLAHKQLDTWRLSIDVVTTIYASTQKLPPSETYNLSNQFRRAVVSISSNIAEGAARISPTDRRRFYEIARSLLVEIDTQLESATRLRYLTREDLTSLAEQCHHLFAALSRLIERT
jgi:four helix bundle protein